MTGPPCVKEPDGAGYLNILVNTSSVPDTNQLPKPHDLLALPDWDTTYPPHPTSGQPDNTSTTMHENPVTISVERSEDDNNIVINVGAAVNKIPAKEVNSEKLDKNSRRNVISETRTNTNARHHSKRGASVESSSVHNSDKVDTEKKKPRPGIGSKKYRRYSTNKLISDKPSNSSSSSSRLWRKSSYCRQRASRLDSLKLPVLTPHNVNAKPRGSLCSVVSVQNASSSPSASSSSKVGAGDSNLPSGASAILLTAPGGRAGCVRSDGRGRIGSFNEATSSSLSSLLLQAPSSTLLPPQALSSSSSPSSLSPSLSLSSTAFSFTSSSSPQSTTLCPANVQRSTSSSSPSSSNNAIVAAPSSSSSSSLSATSLTITASSNHCSKNREEFSFIVRGRGLSRAVDESHPPIETIVDDDLLNRTYMANIQKAYESQLNTPCSSGHTSPTIKESQSPLSVSHGGWTTGNTTERSSLDSSYSLDDFDKQAATTVGQHFTEIESLLFEGHSSRGESSSSASTPPQAADVFRECQEWVTQFPHLRVLGKQACPSKDTGFYHVAPSPHVLNSTAATTTPRPTSSLLMDATDYDLSTSTDSQSLSLVGHNMPLCRLPLHTSLAEGDRSDPGVLASLSSSSASTSFSSSHVSSLGEEVLEEDGIYEDIIAVDYKNIYEENMENKKQITPRRRREGFPPITPNACVKDSVTSGAFDHIWQEVMSWMRQLLMKYTAEIADSKLDVISFSPIHHHRHQTTPASRELSFIHSRQPFPMQRSHTHVGSSTDRSIDGILHISSMPLQTRNQLGEVTESQVLSSNRPGSSLNLQHPNRPMSTLRSQRGARGGRLAPLGDRTKTPNTEEERPSKPVAMEALRVRRLPTINDPLPSPNFHRNGALPPLEMDARTQPRKLLQSNRASSAIDKDMRFLSLKDKAHLGEQARPNTTHTMRSETPFGGLQNRRSSTPLGTSIIARNTILAKQALDVRGNSLQVVGGVETVSHFHPDILEDTQEGPQDDVIRTHWNPPPAQVSHNNPYRRGKTSIR